MAQGRIVLRTLGSSRKFAALGAMPKIGEFAQVLYPMLITNSDVFGRLAGDAYGVKYAIWPTARRTEQEFEAALEAMRLAGLILRYPAGEGIVIQILKFDDGQPGLRKDRRGEQSRFAAPPADLIPENPGNSGILPDTILKRTQENLREGKTYVPPSAGADSAQPAIARFCECFKTRYGQNPRITKDRSGAIKQLVKEFGVDVVRERIDVFFSAKHDFWLKCGHKLEVFVKDWDSIAAMAAKFKPPAPRNDTWSRIVEKIAASDGMNTLTIQTYFRPCVLEAEEDGLITVRGPAPLTDWIQKHYALQLAAAVKAVKPGAGVRFVGEGT
jgi:hypothetical protein